MTGRNRRPYCLSTGHVQECGCLNACILHSLIADKRAMVFATQCLRYVVEQLGWGRA